MNHNKIVWKKLNYKEWIKYLIDIIQFSIVFISFYTEYLKSFKFIKMLWFFTIATNLFCFHLNVKLMTRNHNGSLHYVPSFNILFTSFFLNDKFQSMFTIEICLFSTFLISKGKLCFFFFKFLKMAQTYLSSVCVYYN